MRVLVVTNMYPTPEEPASGTFVRDDVEALRRAGVEVDVLLINGPQSKWNYVWGIFRFWWALLKRSYDVIHAHYAITGFIARLQFRHPVIVTYHGSEIKDHVPRWLRSLARRGPRLFDRVIVVNQQARKILNDDAKVRVIPCGVDFEKFQPVPLAEARSQLGLPLDKPLVLWAGQYWQIEKRFELVEASMQVLKRDCPDADLVVVSGQPHSVVPVYMSACDVFVFTSWSEGSPMVIKEAMACNLPVVSTDVGDVVQVIEGCDGCYIVPPDSEAVADKLFAVLQKRQRTNGRARIRHLGADATAQRVIAVYNELVRPSVD